MRTCHFDHNRLSQVSFVAIFQSGALKSLVVIFVWARLYVHALRVFAGATDLCEDGRSRLAAGALLCGGEVFGCAEEGCLCLGTTQREGSNIWLMALDF